MNNSRLQLARQFSAGITLIEVVLASALTVALMILIGSAIDLHLRMTDIGRTDVEEAQLARAVMRVIEADIQNAVWKNPVDFSAFEQLAADTLNAGGAAAAGAAADAGIELPTEEELAASELPPTMIGLYGSSTEIQVDVSRLPRIDEYDPQYVSIRERRLADIPSDIKTVTYFMLSPGLNYGRGEVGENPTEENQIGLVRRVLDRAVSQYALNNGDIMELYATAEVMAPEVSMLMFRYFDGYQWNEEWDSEALGGLPMAVEVVVAIRPIELTYEEIITNAAQASQGESFTIGDNLLYRRVIRIPIASPIDQEAFEEESLEETEEAI